MKGVCDFQVWMWKSDEGFIELQGVYIQAYRWACCKNISWRKDFRNCEGYSVYQELHVKAWGLAEEK